MGGIRLFRQFNEELVFLVIRFQIFCSRFCLGIRQLNERIQPDLCCVLFQLNEERISQYSFVFFCFRHNHGVYASKMWRQKHTSKSIIALILQYFEIDKLHHSVNLMRENIRQLLLLVLTGAHTISCDNTSHRLKSTTKRQVCGLTMSVIHTLVAITRSKRKMVALYMILLLHLQETLEIHGIESNIVATVTLANASGFRGRRRL